MGRATWVERMVRLSVSHDDDSRSLRLALLDELRQIVGFDAYVWLLTAPDTEVGAAPLADVPSLAELPRLVRLKYLTTVNRWTRLRESVGLLRTATGGQRERSLMWQEILVDYDVGDVASVVFRDRFGCWAFLDLWRIGPDAAFTEADAESLTGVAGPITDALRRCQARTFEIEGTDSDRTGPVVLALSPDLEVRAQTPETAEYLRRLVPPEGDRPPVPAGAYNVAAQLLAVEAGVDDHSPTARVHLAGGNWLTLRAARMGGSVDGDIAVTIEPTSPAERTSLFVRACGLSAREAQLVTHLSAGADTHELAQRMFVSEHTVQDHLKSIFAKTGTRNRRMLLARAIGR